MSVPVVKTWETNESSVKTASIDLSRPFDVAIGELLWIFVRTGDNNGAETFTGVTDTPSWTKLVAGGDQNTDDKFVIYYRIADGTEEATVTVGWSGGSFESVGWYLRVSGVNTASPINQTGSVVLSPAGTSHEITGVTTDAADCLAFYLFGIEVGGTDVYSVAGAGWSETTENTSGGVSAISGSWGTKQQASAGATGTATITSTLSDGGTGVQFAVKGLAAKDHTISFSETVSTVLGFEVGMSFVKNQTESAEIGEVTAITLTDASDVIYSVVYETGPPIEGDTVHRIYDDAVGDIKNTDSVKLESFSELITNCEDP
jgi:hypothetical protein